MTQKLKFKKELTEQEKKFCVKIYNSMVLQCTCITGNCKFCKASKVFQEEIERIYSVKFKPIE